MHPLINIAVRAARRAGEVIVRSLVRLESLEVTSKGRNDYVSEIDRSAEREIIDIIHKHYPEHAILAEESGSSGENETVWIIDPLDGTTNFLHGFPVFSVSIACQVKGRLEHAVVYDPMRGEIFSATRGSGAHLENHRIRVSKARTLDGALVATGFPYRANMKYLDAYMGMLRAVTEQAAGVRRPGSAALDLAYVAAGRVDGFWEIGLAPWDTAAGTLLIQEAGGRIGTLTGGEYRQGGHIVAGTPRVYTALLELLAPHVPAELHEQEASGNELRRALTATQLTLLGIGGVIGTGIFVLTGVAAAQNAGPALALSFIFAGIGCMFAGLCYAEFAAMIPVSGSAYSYSYATLGEGIAWFIGWNLILEYLFAVATVSVGWSGYAVSLLDQLHIHIPDALSHAPFDQDRLTEHMVRTGAIINVPAMLIVSAIATICYIGIKQSATFNSWIVTIKVTVIILFILFGISFINTANWHPFVPPNAGHFGEFGWSGVLKAAGVIFFAYSGFA